jgi:hypothetical protein
MWAMYTLEYIAHTSMAYGRKTIKKLTCHSQRASALFVSNTTHVIPDWELASEVELGSVVELGSLLELDSRSEPGLESDSEPEPESKPDSA